ncbi:MAG: hypothetical protein WA996_06010 [Candidatus Promineifilaceae bacterium]
MHDVLTVIGNVVEEEFHFSPEIEKALRADELAWENFQRYSGSYQRIR